MNPSQRESAKEHVLYDLRREVKEKARVVKAHPSGFCATYRREIRRLWRLALKAVEET